MICWLTCAALSGQAQNPRYKWRRDLWFPDTTHADFYLPSGSLQVDEAGNQYVIGHFLDSTLFSVGGIAYRAPVGGEAIVIKYDASGNVRRVLRLPIHRFRNGGLTCVTMDGAGNYYLVGQFSDSLQVGPNRLRALNQDYFVSKWDTAGTLLWVSSGGQGGWRFPRQVVVNPHGGLYLTGTYYGKINNVLAPAHFGAFTLPGLDATPMFFLRLSATGTPLWVRGSGIAAGSGRSNCLPTRIGCDATGNLYITGMPWPTNQYGCFTWDNQTFCDDFWLRLDPSGNRLASFQHTNTYLSARPSLVVDSAGNSYKAYLFNDSVQVGNVWLPAPQGITDAVVARYDPSGGLLWYKRIFSLAQRGSITFCNMTGIDRTGRVYFQMETNYPTTVDGITIPEGCHTLAFDQLSGHLVWQLPGYDMRWDAAVNASGTIGLMPTNNSRPFPALPPPPTAPPAGARTFPLAQIIPRANTIRGQVFVDANANGQLDLQEAAPLLHPIIEVSPGPLYASTNAAGHYEAVVELGSFTTALPHPPPYYTVAPVGSHAASFTTYANTVAGHDFALQPIPNQQDLQLTLTPIGRARPGFPLSYQLAWRNIGTVPIPSGSATLSFDPRLSFTASSTPATLAGQTLTWQLPALPPNQAGTLTARFQLSPTAQLGDSLAASARLLPLAGDQTPADNVSLVRQLITGSFDPNDILVNHEQLTPQQVQQGEWLEYTIRFQNTGTDTAFSILLRDTLPTHQLNLSTLQLQAASHSPAWQLSPTGILTVRFPGIHLPHQAIDDAGSNGFFRFRVRTRTSLVAGNRIPNRAHIYFDFNPPVATNTALTTITSPLGLSEAAGPADLRVWPNPATGTLHVEWSHDSPAVLTLLDALGRPVRTGATGPRARTTLHLAGLPPGLYLLRALTGHQAGTRRVVIR